MSALNALISKFKRVIYSLLFIYLAVGVFLYIFQRSFIYFPVGNVKDHLLVDTFEIEDHKILASVLNRGNNKAILYFGGNAEDVDYNVEAFSEIFPKYTIYLVKYRGYGGSSGEPSEQALYSDAIHIYDQISKRHENVSVIGRSLGSSVATYVASKKNVHKLALVTPFDSIESIAQSKYPIYPMQILLKDKHDSLSRAGDISADTLVLVAEMDTVVELPHTKRLMEEISSKMEYSVIADSGHNDISAYPEYKEKLAIFFNN